MTRPFRLRIVLALSLAGCFVPIIVTPARAADCTPRYQVTGTVPNQGFGSAVATIGDVNGDGFPDFAVGAPAANPVPLQSPAVYVLSGRDGTLLYKEPGPVGSEFGSAIAALGDINGDGVPDFLVGATESVGPGGGCIFAISGANGGVIYDVVGQQSGAQLGSAIVGLGDIDGDGIPDFAAGAPHAAGMQPDSGAVFVFSGATGDLATPHLFGQLAGDRFGTSVAFIRGTIDPGPPNTPALLVGAPGVDVTNAATTFNNAGAVYEIVLPTGSPTRKLTGNFTEDHFGASVAALGDIDGDGLADLAAGAPNALFAPGQHGGEVRVFSGATASEIFVHHTTIQGDSFGAATGGTKDVTGDVVPDLIVGAPGEPASGLPGSLSVFSNGSGLELCRVAGQTPGEGFGIAFDSIGDLDGDGFPEWAAGAPAFSVGPVAPLGRVSVFGVAPGPPPGHPSFLEIDQSNPFPFTVNLRWGPVPPTCAGGDYAVYMGRYFRMGQGLTNHLPDTCTTGGATQVSIPEPANFLPGTALYFIVTAQTQSEEGSYGQGTLGNEHPPSSRPCHVFLNTGTCQ
ncbi:MAG: FG-GAP repeat protein [Acidobacteria bacterium]|nr:FG-GAP repeat protein [Acidobacteriota bacterium]